jgi:hypothetical protein
MTRVWFGQDRVLPSRPTQSRYATEHALCEMDDRDDVSTRDVGAQSIT